MSNRKRHRQYGALPYALDGEEMRVLLVTSRGTGRWIIPKGWPMRLLPPHKAAAREALEEAGVVGKSQRKAIGSYEYEKIADDGTSMRLSVDVFPLNVEYLKDDWQEASERHRQWFAQSEAADLVYEPELKSILRDYRPPVPRSGKKALDGVERGLDRDKNDARHDNGRKNRKH